MHASNSARGTFKPEQLESRDYYLPGSWELFGKIQAMLTERMSGDTGNHASTRAL
jgi:hypothetical protein